MRLMSKLAVTGALAVGVTAGAAIHVPDPPAPSPQVHTADTVQVTTLKRELTEARRTIAALQAPSQRDGLVTLNPTTGQFFLKNLKTPEFTVHVLQGRVMDRNLGQMFNVESVLHAGRNGFNPLSGLQRLSHAPIEIQQVAATIPTATVMRTVTTAAGPALRQNGISGLQVRFAPGNHLSVAGRKGIFGFTAQATLQQLDGHHLRVAVNDVHVGFLPLPAPLRSAVLAMATQSSGGTLQRSGEDGVVVDAAAYLPPNVKLTLGSVQTTSTGINLTAHGMIAPTAR